MKNEFITYNSQKKGAHHATQGHTGGAPELVRLRGKHGRAFIMTFVGRNGQGRVGKLSKLRIG